MATPEATRDYFERFTDSFGRTYFRRFDDLTVSSVGIGTYLGDPTPADDERYREAVRAAIEGGINVVDTARNYRRGRSERAVGRALRAADVPREAVLVATKAGFVPFEGGLPDDPGAHLREEYPEFADEIVRGHCLEPGFVDDQVEASLDALGLDAVDLYYVHNPETQLEARPREAVYDRLEATFERLERHIAAGDVGAYGVATWEAFRVPPEDDAYLSLPEVVSRARAAADAAGNDATGLRAIQLPFNVEMADAFTVRAHDSPGGRASALEFAREAGLSVVASASLAQGRLAEGLPDEVAAKLEGDAPAQRAINFARSAPGVTCALVGMRSREHVAEALAAGAFDPLGADAFDATFE